MIYLASPYWAPSPAERHLNYKAACRATVKLLRAGQIVFSPVVYGHALIMFDVPDDWEFWQQQDLAHLRRCDEVAVLTYGNWRQSLGVTAELRLARELGKPIRYIAPDDAHVGPTSRAAAESGHTGQTRSAAFCGPQGEPQRETS